MTRETARNVGLISQLCGQCGYENVGAAKQKEQKMACKSSLGQRGGNVARVHIYGNGGIFSVVECN
ncbi:hypothetical protein AGMMS49521_1730 [Campylobacterota bacterium]|nr:hypothetical protein AGMMS49521_1730 [Campylobacterota bacterium]